MTIVMTSAQNGQVIRRSITRESTMKHPSRLQSGSGPSRRGERVIGTSVGRGAEFARPAGAVMNTVFAFDPQLYRGRPNADTSPMWRAVHAVRALSGTFELGPAFRELLSERCA